MKKILLLALTLLTGLFVSSQKLVVNIPSAHVGEVLSVAVNSEGTSILSGGVDKRAYIWEAKTGKKSDKSFGSHTDKITTVAYNANGSLFVTAGGEADKKLIVWNATNGSPKSILKGHTAGVTAAAFNPINDYIVTGGADGKVLIYDENGRLTATLEGHTKAITSVAYSPNGKFIVTGSLDKTIRIWNPETWQTEITIEADPKGISCIAVSNDGKYILSGSISGIIKLWNAKTGNQLSDFDYKNEVKAAIFTPDVQYVIATGAGTNITIWDIETRTQIKDFVAHKSTVNALVFNEKNNQLISASKDGDIKVWDVNDLNIGKKKFVKDDATPKLTCSAVTIYEANENGIIENGENAGIKFTVTNEGKGLAYDVTAKISLQKSIKGLVFDNEYIIGNIPAGKTHKIKIPFTTANLEETTVGNFNLYLSEANGNNSPNYEVEVQTKGSINAYIMVLNYDYSSPTGKAEIGSPITLKLMLKNTTAAEAKNIKVNFKFPANVVAIDKLSEKIESMPANANHEVSVQFQANSEFKDTTLKIGLEIEGTAYSNVNDIDLKVRMGKELPVSPNLYMADNNQPLMRGGDPLKGLDVSTAKKDMEIGNYYAFIIGIDKYKGEWTPLKNAVNDAKAVEATLKAQYKFDHFRTLYDEQATRENIIKEMEWLVSNVREKDNVFIYYSGHGDYKKELNKGYWVPIDATSQTSTIKYISNSDIQTFLGGIKSKHTLLISDACFSGDIFRGKTVEVPFENSEKYYQKVNALTSRQAITSGGIEPVMDGGKDGHSVFAYYLIKVLQSNTYKYLAAGQLYEKIQVPVVNNSEQSPNFSAIKNTGDEGGQFIFIKKE